ncbi:MAG: hypothetical protein ABJB12_19830 [Pseudomonadota bacterium]
MSVARGLLQRLALAAFVVVLIGAALSARVILEGESELSASNAAFDRGELESSLDHARRSATLYAPGAAHVTHAYERLTAIALGAESAGQPKIAFLAWQAVRGAALESRHLWLPRKRELDRANQNLARLEALSRNVGEVDRPKSQTQALARLTADDDGPDPGWITVLASGFLLALTGLALAAFHGLEPNGKVRLARARWGLLLLVIGAACWTLAAYRA